MGWGVRELREMDQRNLLERVTVHDTKLSSDDHPYLRRMVQLRYCLPDCLKGKIYEILLLEEAEIEKIIRTCARSQKINWKDQSVVVTQADMNLFVAFSVKCYPKMTNHVRVWLGKKLYQCVHSKYAGGTVRSADDILRNLAQFSGLEGEIGKFNLEGALSPKIAIEIMKS